ncbi:MAG: sensor histidine kinase [Massilia sp.]
MKSLRKQVTHGAALLLLLLTAYLAATSPVRVSASVGAAVLVAVLAGSALHLARARIHERRRVSQIRAALAKERKTRERAEQTLADAQGVLCRLARDQANVRDAERSRIARDIHDDLGQNLLALRIELSLMEVSTSGIHPAIHQKIGVMAHNLDLAIRSLRAVINNLRPPALDQGLRYAMERQLAEFSRVSGVGHQFEAPVAGCDASAGQHDADAVLYRVLQESLSNVARHAQASMVRVALGCDGVQLTLSVADNGVGMPATAADGCGLAGMRERVGAAGGVFFVDSRPGAGTTLTLSVPLRRAAVPD